MVQPDASEDVPGDERRTRMTRRSADLEATVPAEMMPGSVPGGSDATRATMAAGGVLQGETLMPGTVLGDFTVGPLLGRGGMGAVYRGRQRSLDRPVAIKILPGQLGSNEDFRRRFELEARAVAKISSPQVVQVYGAGFEGGCHYFAMEYVEGRDLAERLRAGFRPEVDAAVDLVLQAARGLAAAGEQGIVHRDIKPANMMVTDDGQLKLMDFGLVKLTSADQGVTLAGTVMGTVSYFSPEQGRGEECDHRTDIYALGVVLYELLTGQLPFKGNDPTSVIYQHIHAEPTPPCEINAAISVHHQAVILKCLQKDPRHRYADAQALVRDLEALRGGDRPRTALSDPDRLRGGATMVSRTDFQEPAQRSGGLAWLLVLLLLAGGGAAGWWWYTTMGPGRSLPPPEAPPVVAPADEPPVAPPTTPRPTDEPHAAWRGELRRLMAAGDWTAVGERAGTAPEGALDAALRREWHTGLLAAARSALAAGDIGSATGLGTALASAFPADADAQAFLARLQTVRAIRSRLDELRAQAEAGAPGPVVTTLADLALPEDLPEAIKTARDELLRALRAAAQLLATADQALARGDLDTARQSYLLSFQKAETAAASKGLDIVAICDQFNNALVKGDLDDARKRIAELAALQPGEGVLGGRRTALAAAEAAGAVEAALRTGDLTAAETALAQLRERGGDDDRVADLRHRLDLARAQAAFRTALAAEDLAAAQAALTTIETLDGDGAAHREAAAALTASQLAERQREAAIATAIAAVDGLLEAAAPDWPTIEAQLATLQEAHGERQDLAALADRVLQRRQRQAVAGQLTSLDQAVLTGDAAGLAAVVSAAEHHDALAALMGQPELAFSHRLGSLERTDDGLVATVALTTAMRAVPATTLQYRYRWRQNDAGAWQVVGVERIESP